MICTKNEINAMRKMSNIELFKVMLAYLIDKVSKKVSISIEEGDIINYTGKVDASTELTKITNEIFQIMKIFEQTEQEKMKVQNDKIHILRIMKNSNGKYESIMHETSIRDFSKMNDMIQKYTDFKKVFGTFLEYIEDNIKRLEEDDDKKNVDLYKANTYYKELLSDKNHLFSFIKIEFELVGEDGAKMNNRTWHIFDYNDDEFRGVYNIVDEFKLLPIHIENISEIRPK